MSEILLTLIFLPIVILTARPITVLIHELGHAIPSLILTEGKVELFIGSYGDIKESRKVELNRLHVFFEYNPTLWDSGLCCPSDNRTSIWKQIVIILFGPLFSLLFGFIFLFFFCSYLDTDSLNFVGFLFFASFMLDFYINIKPSSSPIQLYDGRITYNDGEQLRQLFKLGILPEEFEEANELYRNKDYHKAADLYLQVLNKDISNSRVFKLALTNFILAKKFREAASAYKEHSKKIELDSNDYANIGLVYSKLNRAAESMEMYEKSLALNSDNVYALNNRGFQYNLDQEFEKAIIDFNKVLELKQDMSYALSNRGIARIELGAMEDGFHDIKKSLEFDAENSYAFRNLGIYFLYKNDKPNAIESFKKAYELDENTHDIDELLLKAQNL